MKLKFGITGGTGSLGRNLIKNYKNIKKQSYANRNFYLKNYLMSKNIKKFVKKYVE